MRGEATVAIVGGTDASLSPSELAMFSTLNIMAKSETADDACKPFAQNRSGTVLGEGAGVLVLETLKSATNRGAKIYGEILGYGASTDTYHVTSPNENGEAYRQAMENALFSAELEPKNIEYINAHGTEPL